MKNESLPAEMLAVRLHGRGFENIKVEKVPVPEPGKDQLLVRVDAAGVCTSILKLVAQGSDHTFINGWDLSKFPIILGDEGSVTVVEAGANVKDRFPVGSNYVTQPAVDHPPVGHRERYTDSGKGMEKVAVGYSLPGHLSEYMLITEETIAAECLVPMPSEDIPLFAGALCEPLSCVISAQDRHFHIEKETPMSARVPRLGLLNGGVAAVIGAGPMGRLHAEAALRFAPSHLFVVDVMPERLEWITLMLSEKAGKAGTQLHAITADEFEKQLDAVTGGHGVDDLVVAVGNKGVQNRSQYLLARGGVSNLFGGLKRGEHMIELDTLRVHYDEIRFCGSSGGSPSDVAEALRMVDTGEIDPGNHLDMVGSLDCFPEALKMIENATVEGKIVLYPGISQTPLTRVRNWTIADERKFLKQHSSSKS